jgi:hypothetical protein
MCISYTVYEYFYMYAAVSINIYGKRRFVFLGRQTINSSLCQQTCLSVTLRLFIMMEAEMLSLVFQASHRAMNKNFLTDISDWSHFVLAYFQTVL